MPKETAKNEIQTLTQEVAKHEYLYYVKATPEISDTEFDRLFNKLAKLEAEFPEFAQPDSPTKRIGSDIDHDFPEVTHTIPMLSLDKCYSIPELITWAKKAETKVGKKLSFVVEEKIDGMSIILSYKKGMLVQAATRGNGIVGNDITPNAYTIRAVPLKLSEPIDIEVRGEVFLKNSDFKNIVGKDGTHYDSPRNLAAGSIRRKASVDTSRTPLDIFVYEGISGDITKFEQQDKIIEYLGSLGFKINPRTRIFNDVDDNFEKHISSHIQERQNNDYEIDGLVIKINEIEARELLGYTDRFPRWAIAFKFESPEAETIVQGIDIQIGRFGRITPVARLQPVKIHGAVITNATLHNEDYINTLEIAIGDTVCVSRRGDVIPAVERISEKNTLNNLTWKMPLTCPSCNNPLTKDGGHHFCTNNQCPERIKAKLIHFTGKTGMDIENMGPKTIETLISNNLIKQPEDIYIFPIESLKNIQGFGDKKIDLIRAGIEESKKQPFETVLAAIGIKDLGSATIKTLVNNGINSIDALLEIAQTNNESRLMSIEGIAEITAKSIIESLKDPTLITTLIKLKEIGLKFSSTPKIRPDLPEGTLSMINQTWCITGTFENFKPREKAASEIEKRGGNISSSVTSKTTHLLAGESAGSKLDKARRLNIKIVNEPEFLDMIK